MAKINILTEQVYNRIAAGEVVDRPYSVVKELIENSIDAGATEILIFIEQGGKQLIRIIDNGTGIEYDDLKSAYMPHATSKISGVKDLENITTLGFRGEAVASIAAVSQMNITSKTKEGKCYSLSCSGGTIGQIVEAAGENGTDISVKNLFFNTPVRLKFLKSDRAEEADISNFISRFILDRPNISFKYYLNNKLMMQSYGTNEEEALVCVYGASILQNCFKINAEKHGIKICGYIGNQNFFKPNKSYQSVFLNGRYVVNQTISAAVANAYSSYMMKRQYPFYVLYIDVPTEIVDVNVHPNKADVRFSDNQVVYGCIYTVISSILDGNSKALDYVVSDDSQNYREKKETYQQDILYHLNDKEYGKNIEIDTKRRREENGQKIPCSSFSYEEARKEIELDRKSENLNSGRELPFSKEDIANEDISTETKKEETENNGVKPEKSLDFLSNRLAVHSLEGENEKTDEGTGIDVFAENKRFLEEAENNETIIKQNRVDTSSFVFKGSLFNTYLIYENEDCIYLIDQHAAHERLIFDRLKAQMESRTIIQQPLLLPYVLEVNSFEGLFLSDQMENIRAIGFDIDAFGINSYKVSAVPIDLQSIDLKEFFEDILADISGLKNIKLDSLLKDRLAMKACKAAIKGGMDLTKEETDTLLKEIDGNLGLKCPHGRPVVVKLTKYEIEKMFKRIV